MPRYADASKYEILYDLPDGEYSPREVGGICTKTIRAGDSLEVEAFPIISVDRAARAERNGRRSTQAQQKLNQRNCEKKVRRIAEANFKPGDIVLHPTYDYGPVERGMCNLKDVEKEYREMGYPMDDREAGSKMTYFIRRLKRRVAQKGGDPNDFKYMYVTESKKSKLADEYDDLPPRYHHHMIITSLGVLTIEDINELWPYGVCRAQMLDFRFNGLEALACYIAKVQGKNGRKFKHSRNMKAPDERRSNRKISRRRAELIARDVQANGREILEKIYPGYVLEDLVVKYSSFVAGAYIYARMRRREDKNMQRRR